MRLSIKTKVRNQIEDVEQGFIPRISAIRHRMRHGSGWGSTTTQASSVPVTMTRGVHDHATTRSIDDTSTTESQISINPPQLLVEQKRQIGDIRIHGAPDIENTREASILTMGSEETRVDNFYSPHNRDFYKSFGYADLDKNKRQIRLLRIHIEDGDIDDQATVTCDLIEQQNLKDVTGNFTTISYCAGDPTETEIVIVNGLAFNAFARLGHALRQARSLWRKNFGSRELLLWADQICIDQSRFEERSHQVNFMGDIYAAAEQVLISLSKEGDPRGGVEWLLQTEDENELRSRFATLWHSSSKYWTAEESHRGHDSFVRTIVHSPYWSRAWVRQEYVRSRERYIMASFEFSEGRSFMSSFARYFDRDSYTCHCPWSLDIPWQGTQHAAFGSPALATCPDNCGACLYFKGSKEEDAQMKVYYTVQWVWRHDAEATVATNATLFWNLGISPHCQTSDPRDKIYAFLGISEPDYGIIPSYDSGTVLADVLCHVTAKVILYHGHLDMLQCLRQPLASMFGSTSNRPGLPSWVPDFLDPTLSLRFHRLSLRSTASRRKYPVATFLPDEQGQPARILQVYGKRTDLHLEPVGGNHYEHEGVIQIRGDFEAEDQVWFVYGFMVMCILRPQGEHYKLVGLIDRYEKSTGYEQIRAFNDEIDTGSRVGQAVQIC